MAQLAECLLLDLEVFGLSSSLGIPKSSRNWYKLLFHLALNISKIHELELVAPVSI